MKVLLRVPVGVLYMLEAAARKTNICLGNQLYHVENLNMKYIAIFPQADCQHDVIYIHMAMAHDIH
jgi:hypothetical protein